MAVPIVVAAIAVAWILLRLYLLSMRERNTRAYLTFALVGAVPFFVFVGVLEIFLVSVSFGSLLFWLFMIPVWICALKVKRLIRREMRRPLFRRGVLKVPPGAEVVPERTLVVLIVASQNEQLGISKFKVFEPGELIPENPPSNELVQLTLRRLSSGEEMYAMGKRWVGGRHGRFKITNRNGTPKVRWAKVQPEQA